jgi:hypothetical protein
MVGRRDKMPSGPFHKFSVVFRALVGQASRLSIKNDGQSRETQYCPSDPARNPVPNLGKEALMMQRWGDWRTRGPAARVSIRSRGYGAFRFFLAALVAISAGATCIENGLHPLMLLFLPLMGAAIARTDYRRPYLWDENIILALLIVYMAVFTAGLFIAQGKVALPVFMVYFTFGILFVRLMLPLTDRSLSQVIALTVGLILINSILTNHIAFGMVLPVYLFVIMGTLLLFHLARAGMAAEDEAELPADNSFSRVWLGRLALCTIGVLALTAILFVLVPRPFLAIPGLTAAMAQTGGLARMEQRITYKDMAGMAGRNRIAFKVLVESGDLPDTPYWRGQALDRFDGREWSPSSRPRGMGRLIKYSPSETLDLRIIPFRLQSNIVYVTGLPVVATGRMDRPLMLTDSGGVVVDSPFLFADSYAVQTVNRPVPVSRSHPPSVDTTGITPRMRRLAQRWTANLATPRDRAGALASRLRSQYTYRLQPPPPPEGANSIEYFLFKSRTGNCEQFAGALCLLLRAVQIPARVVEGFAGVEKTDSPGELLVRFSRAHAWVEAHLGGDVWTELDASPAIGADIPQNRAWRWLVDFYDNLEHQWVKQVIYFDRSDQAEVLRALKRVLTGQLGLPDSPLGAHTGAYLKAASIGAGVLVIGAVALTLVRRRRADLPHLYLATMRKLARTGVLNAVHPWHEHNRDEIIRKAPEARDAVTRFMETYLKGRFGAGDMESIHALKIARRVLLRSVAAAQRR